MASTCIQVEELLPAYDEGDLGPDEARRLERHLAGCAACRSALAGLRSSWESLGAWPEVEPAPAWRQEFWRALGRDDERRRWGPLRFLGGRRLVPPAMAALLALGFFGGTLWQGRPVEPTGAAASWAISRDVAQLALAPADEPLGQAPQVGELEGPFSSEMLDQAYSTVRVP